MAVKVAKYDLSGIPAPNAYLRISPGSIVGGKFGWTCMVEVFASADASKPKIIRDVPPEHMLVNLDTAAQQKLKDAWPSRSLPSLPAATVQGPCVPYEEGKDPYALLYAKLMSDTGGDKA